jgi:hypothetical protein
MNALDKEIEKFMQLQCNPDYNEGKISSYIMGLRRKKDSSSIPDKEHETMMGYVISKNSIERDKGAAYREGLAFNPGKKRGRHPLSGNIVPLGAVLVPSEIAEEMRNLAAASRKPLNYIRRIAYRNLIKKSVDTE